MFPLFKKAPVPPELEVKDYQQGQLEVRSPKILATGSQQVVLKLQGKNLPAKINVESGLDDQLVYWAQVEEPANLAEQLISIFPQEVVAETVDTFVEKRSEARSNKVLGVLSREIPGFKTVCYDVSSRGVRIACDKEMPTGARPVRFSLDLDDARIPPLDLAGEVLWCKAKEPKGFWVGVKFTQISPQQQAVLDKFLEEARQVEHGVITRDYE